MKKMLPVIFFVLLLSSKNSAAYEPSPKEIIVAGKIVNAGENSPKVIRIDFTDVFTGFSSRAQVIGADGTFRIAYLALYPMQFQMEYSEYIFLYAEPGDSVFITIDAERIKSGDYVNAAVFSGDRAGINNFLWKGIDYIHASLQPLYYAERPSDTLSVPEYNRIVEEKILAFHSSVSNFARTNNVSREVEEILKGIIDLEISLYWVQNYKSADYSPAASTEKQGLLENKMFGTYDPANFKYREWRNHAFNYANTLFHRYAAKDYHNDESLKGWEKVGDALKEKPAGFNRDYITAMVMDYFYQPADSLPGAWDLISSPFVKEYITRSQGQTIPEFDDIDIPGISYLAVNGTVEPVPSVSFIKTLSARYPGKVIYIDVWGTWCSACKALFPAAKLRKEEMRGKDVVFVYLCVTSEMNPWLKDIETLQLEGEHYFLDEDASKLFTVNYQIASYPRYLIVGKDGKVKNNDASRPNWKVLFTEEMESHL